MQPEWKIVASLSKDRSHNDKDFLGKCGGGVRVEPANTLAMTYSKGWLFTHITGTPTSRARSFPVLSPTLFSVTTGGGAE